MKRHLIPIIFIAAYSFADCTDSDFDEEKSCWVDSKDFPMYSNGTRKEVGKPFCFKLNAKMWASDSGTIQGIPVKKMIYRTPCKVITKIDQYKSTHEYVTYYSAETMYTEDASPWYEVHRAANVFYQDGVIELFRNNGTLRFRGKVILGEQVVTSGDCYNKSGSAPTRHTNNADTCK